MLNVSPVTTRLLLVKDLQAAERRGARVALAMTNKLKRLVYRILRTGQIPIEFVTDIEKLYEKPILETMQTADLLGRKRAWITAERSGLKLDIHSAAVDYFNRVDPGASKEAIEIHQANALKVVRDLATTIESKLRDELRESVVQGETLKDSKARLASAMDRLGLSPKNSGQIETIIRTQTQLAFASGRWKAERLDPDIDEMLWGYKYVTAGDSRVRDEHKNLDGVTLPKDHKFWDTFMPPNGFNCRCQAIPIYDQRPVVFPPKDAEPDKTFNFNAGRVLYGTPVVKPKPAVYVPPATPSIDRLTAATKNWSETQVDVRRLLAGESVEGLGGERARAILQALAGALLNPVRLYRGDVDHRSGIIMFTSRRMKNPTEVIEPNTARAIQVSPTQWIVDVRK